MGELSVAQMALLRELWTGTKATEEVKTTNIYDKYLICGTRS